MANSYKDILITPNRGNTADPKIEFRGANTSVNTSISLYSYHTSNGTLSFEGSAGQLFSITNDLTGSIFSVNDVSGIPSIEVFANGVVSLAGYNGNVGIGTTSPGQKLDVNGAIQLRSGNPVYFFNTNYFVRASTGLEVQSGDFIRFLTNGANERVRVDASGNVGIGTTNPGYKLHFYNSSASDVIFESGTSGTSGKIILKTSDNADTSKYFGMISYWTVIGVNSNEGFRVNEGSDTLLQVSGSTSSYPGRVGIGTTTPGAKLHVKGTWVSGEGILQIDADSGTQFSGLTLQNNGTIKAYLYHDNTSAVTWLLTAGAEPILFGTNNGTERMRITSGGAVGIGNSNPPYLFTVGTTGTRIDSNGDIYATRADGSTGVIFFGNSGGRYVYWNGAAYYMPGGELYVNGTQVVKNSGTWGISITGNAGTVSDGMYLASVQTVGGRKGFSSSQSVGSMLNATGSLGGLELYGGGSTNAAFMSFHRPGAYASYFGIDNDNQFAVGGWSAGAALAFFKCRGLGVGTAASSTTGEIRATSNVTAYYSDARLKEFKGKINNALNKVNQLNGYYYIENEIAEKYGYNNKEEQVGVSAQEVEAVLPHVVTRAPFDIAQNEDGTEYSKSGEDYKTVRYERLIPLLIEAIKELKKEVDELKKR